jgi:hypothetical protein
MKLEIARGLFLVGALGVATVAVAAWEQPRSTVLTSIHGEGNCPLPRVQKAQVSVTPDKDFLLFMLGLSQGVRNQG